MIKAYLVIRAMMRHGYHITPPARRKWRECFTITAGKHAFWYNTRAGHTRTVMV